MSCNCAKSVNERLAENGGELLVDLFNPQRTFVATIHKADVKRKKKLPLVQASFCPFCGVKYPPSLSPFKRAASVFEE